MTRQTQHLTISRQGKTESTPGVAPSNSFEGVFVVPTHDAAKQGGEKIATNRHEWTRTGSRQKTVDRGQWTAGSQQSPVGREEKTEDTGKTSTPRLPEAKHRVNSRGGTLKLVSGCPCGSHPRRTEARQDEDSHESHESTRTRKGRRATTDYTDGHGQGRPFDFGLGASAPKGHNGKAQGNALGSGHATCSPVRA